MSQPRPRTNHASSLPFILLGISILLCSIGTTQAFPWPWQSQKPLISSNAIDIDHVPYPEQTETGNQVIGIHLGDTYARVGIFRNDSFEMITNKFGNSIIPNMVNFTDYGPLVGDELEVDSAHTIFGMERLIGRSFDDPVVQDAIEQFPFKIINMDNKPYIEVEAYTQVINYSPEDITTFVLGRMRQLAEEYLGVNIHDAIVTVPVDFNDAQRVS